MPQTSVEAPDGTIITVEHPDGASESDILAFAQREFSDRQFAATLPEPALSAKSEPTSDRGSFVDPLLQGATFSFADELAGLRNVVSPSGGLGGFESFSDAFTGAPERFREGRDFARENEAAFRERNPKTSLALEVLGGITSGGVGAAKAGAFAAAKNAPTIAGKLKPIIQTGATQGGIFGAGASDADLTRGEVGEFAEDTLAGIGIGATTAPIIPAGAAAVKGVTRRIFNPQSGNRAFQKDVQLLKDKAGIDVLTTGQKTGSRQLRSTETTFGETLLGAKVGGRIEENRQKLQGALMRMSGFTKSDSVAGLLNNDTIDRAGRLFARRYGRLTRGRSVDLNEDKFIDDIATVEANNLSLLEPFQKKQVGNIVDAFLDEALDGPISAARYKQMRSRLSKLSTSGTDGNIRSLYKGLRDALDDAFARQTGKGKLRSQIDLEYSRYAKLRDTFNSSGSIDTSRGFLPLSSILRRSSRFGDKEFNDLLRAGQSVLGDPVANSGSASRLANLLLLGEGTASAALGGADAGVVGFGVPLGISEALSRGITGGSAIDALIQSGLITAPLTVPVAQRASE
jgi:hypothetical protein